MGDRYNTQVKCAGCGKLNDHYHAESSGFMSFNCKNCKKVNWVSIKFVARIVTKEEERELYRLNGFE